MVQCPVCATPVAPGATSCQKCGTPVSPSTLRSPAPMSMGGGAPMGGGIPMGGGMPMATPPPMRTPPPSGPMGMGGPPMMPGGARMTTGPMMAGAGAAGAVTMAGWGLGLAIIGICCAPLAIIGLILGIAALKQLPNGMPGHGLALSTVVVGIITSLIGALFFIAFLAT